MKKLMLVLLAAGLFVACGNKQKEEAPETDTVNVEVTDEIIDAEEAPVAEMTEESAVETQKPAPKPATPAVTEEPTQPEATTTEPEAETKSDKPVKKRR